MGDKTLVRKLFKNKRNNQVSITLPINILKGKEKKPEKIRIKDWDWL